MRPVIVIPARYASTRLPGKPLLELAGKPLIQHVHERAMAMPDVTQVVIATDDVRIQAVAEGFGASVCMTSSQHETGSDRLAEVVQIHDWNDEQVVVNLQGDEPLTPVVNLQQLAGNLLQYPDAAIATLATPITEESEFTNPNAVKVVCDHQGMALYFSRATIPLVRERAEGGGFAPLRHVGMYAYRAGFLKQFAELQPCALEQAEKLEQLRALYYGFKIHVDSARELPPAGIDTPEDAERVRGLLVGR